MLQNYSSNDSYRVGSLVWANFSAPILEHACAARAGPPAAPWLISCNAAAPRLAVRRPGSSPRSEQRRTWLSLAEQIEIFRVKARLATFKSKKRKCKVVRRLLRKKKQLDRRAQADRVHVRLRWSIVNLVGNGRCRSLSRIVVLGFFIVYSFSTEAFCRPRGLHFSTTPVLNKTFLEPLEALRIHTSMARQLSVSKFKACAGFSCLFGMDRTIALTSLTVFETKNKMHMHIWLAHACNIFRVCFTSRNHRAHVLSSVAKSSLTQPNMHTRLWRAIDVQMFS